MKTEYVIRTKRSHCVTGVIVGAVLLYFGLDLRFFHAIPGSRITSELGQWAAFAIFAGGGTLFITGSLRQLLHPSTLLMANEQGITVFSGGTSKVWDAASRSWKVTRAEGQPKRIPWSQVHSIGEGVVLEESTTEWDHRLEWGDEGGSVTVGKIKRVERRCLQVLCDPEVRLDGFGLGNASRGWDGYNKEEMQALSSEERECLRPEDTHSGFVFRSEYLSHSLGETVRILRQMSQAHAT